MYLHLTSNLLEYLIKREVEGGHWKVSAKSKGNNSKQADFSQIVKKAYEKGVNENEMTLEKIMEELKADLKNMMIS
jgi:hypothetical protein